MKKIICLLTTWIFVLTIFCGCEGDSQETTTEVCTEESSFSYDDIVYGKPVIYLYPEQQTEILVTLDYAGELMCTYPAYDHGWHVLASPDGTLRNLANGEEYSYLFWEGIHDAAYDMSEGFVVKGEDTADFLREMLSKMGLTPHEYNEFIVYWLPRMQENPYNLITFRSEDYTEIAKLSVTPEPDSVLRVFMVYQALEEPIQVETPVIVPFERIGFTVVEWGGAEIK